MEFSIDIHTELNGEILIEDFSKEYGQYLAEDLPVYNSYDFYKYSESATLNAIMKVNINSIILKDVLLNNHTEDLDYCAFRAIEDGYYVIEHMVLPNKLWYDNASKEYKEYYDTVYIIDNEKVYKEVKGNLEECTVKEIMERNIEGTTIKKCRVEVFFTGNLQQCYVNYCKNLFNQLLNTCNKENTDLFSRDFIWMTLNVIDYLIGFKQYMEAQRIIEVFQSCGSPCSQKGPYVPKITHCGCS